MVRLQQPCIKRKMVSKFRLNSTMVRLQHLFVAERETLSDKSQFHYGSITTNIFNTVFNQLIKSQFHYGSITTLFVAEREFLSDDGLNSTMVRLQLKKEYEKCFYFYCLNSTMVRLQLKRSLFV